MIFSIIVPSYNQEDHIRGTLLNLKKLKQKASEKGITIEILLFDNQSNGAVQQIISEFKPIIDLLEIQQDKGQYDAINKGISLCKGDYWTWLNTDDYIDIDSFFRAVGILKNNPSIDYIYGGIKYIDESGKFLFEKKATSLKLRTMVHRNPGIYQPGSFFRTEFTNKIGLLSAYRCCFDYEYILRCLWNNAKFYCCDFPLASFRYYSDSKTGSIIPIFLREQLQISKKYGRTPFSFLTSFLKIRLFKHQLFPNR